MNKQKSKLIFLLAASLMSIDCNAQTKENIIDDGVFIRFVSPLVPQAFVENDEYGVASANLLVVGSISRDSSFYISQIIRLPEISVLPGLSFEETEKNWIALEESIRRTSKQWKLKYDRSWSRDSVGTIYLIFRFSSEKDSHAKLAKSYIVDVY